MTKSDEQRLIAESERPDETAYALSKLVASYNALSSAIGWIFDGDWRYVGRDDARAEIEERLATLVDEARQALTSIQIDGPEEVR
jgi:uncharacterized protein (UPF0297 family)